ncbi:GNAT family N-acetyltransferase [Streptomyces roseoverticillatus]|uniref:GNAT family N-acetyltransferase n=1 Tax=Streptomyces roseoverticillatus TaxID=66429 RepID=UPI00340AB652
MPAHRATAPESVPAPVSVQPASEADRPVLERLWLMFRHDMSAFDGSMPARDGTFRSDRLGAALAGADAGWAAYLLRSGPHPAGLALVRGVGGPARVMNSFFVARGARGKGAGLRAAREVVARHPGPWEIPFQDANAVAVRFWRRVAAEAAGEAWAEERRPVPGRPDLPPDVWISFTGGGTGPGVRRPGPPASPASP